MQQKEAFIFQFVESNHFVSKPEAEASAEEEEEEEIIAVTDTNIRSSC